ncbi:MAG TPA: hypothetical protein VMH38_01865 [Thermoplasmata archaeon]|nr:hypothetical protein [Thermoplasmata archaeon]
MGKRWVMGLVAMVAVVAVGGIGFAAFTTSAYINGAANAGTFQLQWQGPTTGVGSETYNTCPAPTGSTTTNTSDTLTLTAGNLAPGDSCTFTAVLADVGSLPGQTYDFISAVSGPCTWFFYDNYGGHAAPPVPETPLGPISIAPGSPIAYSATLGLWSGQDNSCQGASLSFTVEVTGTAS